MNALGALLVVVVAVGACRSPSQPPAHRAVEPAFTSASAIPDGPASGRVAGAPFQVRDARYVVDRRVGYAHTDIKLSAGRAEAPCGPLSPPNAPSLWLRLSGDAPLPFTDVPISQGEPGAWSVHYQAFDGERWQGVSDGTAFVSLREAGPDRVRGGISVCFSDDSKSCVSGSFEAQSCPSSLDQPVRGAVPPETVPEKLQHKLVAVPSLLPDAAPP